ncbi:MAG: phosphoribosyltransferase [Alphaproteobacteria bacterium]|nr:phosphoribosyltransferase [Alphaproteobacteria bacterium]
MKPYFSNRREAGKELAKSLSEFASRGDVIVLALPRGGVPVGYEVAKAIHAPLDLMLVRKLGLPGHEELAIGAISLPGVCVFNHDVIQSFGVSEDAIEAVIVKEEAELDRRNRMYRKGLPLPDLKDKIVILVDDGMATGANMRAAITAVEQQHPSRIVVAVPVCSHDSRDSLQSRVSVVVCLQSPELFFGVGQAYETFNQTTDEEVLSLLAEAKHWSPAQIPNKGEAINAHTSL